ncbi:MAG: hypothetical protein F4018_15850, partial [Acidobacteria bacterium]|nr:hypothetical protein [Acidobacteriota bacterium]
MIPHLNGRAAALEPPRHGESLGRRAHLAAAVQRREKRAVDAEAGDGTRTEAEASAEANAVCRQLVDAPRTVAGEAPAGGLALRTLADHRKFELTACCAACERYVVLD